MLFARFKTNLRFASLRIFPVLAMVLVLGASGPAKAQDAMGEDLRPPTPSVYIDLLYHKMTNQEPDYDAWAFVTDEYKKASEHDKPIVFTKQRNQLQDMYEDMNPSDFIVVRTMVNCAKSYSDLQEIFFFEGFDDETFIEYPGIQDQRKYALVLNGIEKYGQVQMRQDKAQEMLLALGHGGDAHVEIIVKPVAADAETPFEYDGETYWLLMGEIAEFSLWSDRRVKKKVWSDRAKWYVEENPLMDLYNIPKK